LIAHFLATLEWGASQLFFESKLSNTETVLLLDGLDEVPGEADRARMAKLLREVAHRYWRCRIVVTTRPQALLGEVRPSGFEEISIVPFDEADRDVFVERWCECMYTGEPRKADQREHLNEALRVRDISAIAKNPLMLAALTVIHFNGGRLPDNRLELYESIVRRLAEARQNLPGQPDCETRLERLRLLAFGMQDWPGGRVRSLEVDEAVFMLRPLLSPQDALRCLRVEEFDSGIVATRKEGIEFWHLTFQEYLAAVELAGRNLLEIHKTIWEDRRVTSEWREVMRFLAAILRRLSSTRANWLFDDVIAGTGDNLAERARGDRVGRVTPVGLFPSGNTPDGVSDLAGNVWEWTRSDYALGSDKVLRGGSWIVGASYLRAVDRNTINPARRYDYIGFRCIRE
jgi:hypothetical protein